MFCTACGTQKPEGNAQFCANCGASCIAGQTLPPGVAGWSWGAFLLNWIWALGNNTLIGLLALAPYLGFLVMIWLGFKGREMAWKNARWQSVEHFNRVQRRWSQWGIGMTLAIVLAAICLCVYAVAEEENDVTPFSQELRDAIASSSESTEITSEQEEECPPESDEQ